MITHPFEAMDKTSKVRYNNYIKKMQQKYDTSNNNIFTEIFKKDSL